MALAILLAAAEMVTITTVLVWAAVAALITALLLWLAPGLGAFEQIGIFAALSIVFFFVGRALVGRFGQPGGGEPRRSTAAPAQLVGREGVVLAFEPRRGQGDRRRRALAGPARRRRGDPAAGDRVRVTAADGIVVWSRPARDR